MMSYDRSERSRCLVEISKGSRDEGERKRETGNALDGGYSIRK